MIKLRAVTRYSISNVQVLLAISESGGGDGVCDSDDNDSGDNDNSDHDGSGSRWDDIGNNSGNNNINNVES